MKQLCEYTKKENILVYNVRQGWEPLCKFVNKPIPENKQFPRSNQNSKGTVGLIKYCLKKDNDRSKWNLRSYL